MGAHLKNTLLLGDWRAPPWKDNRKSQSQDLIWKKKNTKSGNKRTPPRNLPWGWKKIITHP